MFENGTTNNGISVSNSMINGNIDVNNGLYPSLASNVTMSTGSVISTTTPMIEGNTPHYRLPHQLPERR